MLRNNFILVLLRTTSSGCQCELRKPRVGGNVRAVEDCDPSTGKAKGHFTLEQATKVQKGSRSIGLFFFKPSTRWGWVVSATSRPLYPREKLVPIV
jgi:hypothetical protein